MTILISTVNKRKMGYIGIVSCVENNRVLWRRDTGIYRTVEWQAKEDANREINDLKLINRI